MILGKSPIYGRREIKVKFIDLLKTIYAKFNNRQVINSEKRIPSRKEQDLLLSRLKAGEDHFNNSYNKYKCVCFYHYSRGVLLLYNIASALLYFPLYLKLKNAKKGAKKKKYENLLVMKRGRGIGIEDIFPEPLREKYKVVEDFMRYDILYLDKESKQILKEARKRHPFSFHYNLVLMMRIANQCRIINEYNPEIICTYVCEREFADPILTLYSENNGVRYHGFMHGDFMYQIDHAFMQFSCYWVWDEYYKKMFEELKCTQSMVVYKPGKYKPIVESKPLETDYEYYATYYFSGETKDAIDNLKPIFDKLRDCGKKCKLRPHPRFSNYDYIKQVFSGYFIENCRECSLKKSLETTFYCIAINSTVLSEAHHSGKKVVIDDLTNRNEYSKLKDQEYILLDKADYLLSELLKIDCIE